MDTVLSTLTDTLTELKRQVDMHQSVVTDAHKYVKSTKAALDKAEEELTLFLSGEKQKREEMDKFCRFLNGEPNGGTPAMRATLADLANEVNRRTNQFAPLRRSVLACRETYTGATGAVAFNEERLAKIYQEYRQVAERIRELASEN